MTYNFKTQALSTIIDDLPANEAWWVGTPSAKYIIPIEAVMAALEREAVMVTPQAFDLWGDEMAEELAKIAGVSVDTIKGDNTYNYDDNMSHCVQMYIANTDHGYFVAMAIHRAGDVRCNYTPYVVMMFEDPEAFNETVWGVAGDFVTTLEVDGKTYSIQPNPFSPVFDVWDDSTLSAEIYPDDITDEEMAKAIREAVKE